MKPTSARQLNDAISKAMVAAVAYADLFDDCLSDEELVKLAVGQKIQLAELASVSDRRLVRQDGRWCLAGRECLLGQAESYEAEQQRKLALVKGWCWLFEKLPGVLMVGVTGSVAGGTPEPSDDIDLLIICRAERLWLSRLILTSCLSLAGKRRKPADGDDQVKDLLCLNMWLSTSSLWEQADIYNANELARLVPIYNRRQTFERYLAANGWISDYLPNMEPGRVAETETETGIGLVGLMGNIGEWLSKRLLKGIMRRPSLEVITDDRLQFHPGNHRQQILDRYKAKLTELSLDDIT